MSIYQSVFLCDSRRTLPINQLTDIVGIRYLGSSVNIQDLLFLISPLSLKLMIVQIKKKKKNKNSDFLKNGINNFDEILWVYTSFHTQQYDTIGFFFSEKSMKLEFFF